MLLNAPSRDGGGRDRHGREPNCRWDQAASTKAVSGWNTALGIKTYVVGLPSNDIQAAVYGAQRTAQAGGTDKFIDPSNAASYSSSSTS